MKYMRRTAGHTWRDYKTNTQITKELKITPILDKLLEYKRSLMEHVNRMPRNRLPRIVKHYSPTGRRNYGRPLKRFLDTWDRNGSTSGPTTWQIYDDDEDIQNYNFTRCFVWVWNLVSHTDGETWTECPKTGCWGRYPSQRRASYREVEDTT